LNALPDDLPASEPAASPVAKESRRRPRNYFSRGDNRRLFWTFMPPAVVIFLALSWIERAYFRPASPPPPAQVDTVLKSANVERTVGDAVTIEAEPQPLVAEPDELGASLHALETVRDDTVFRPADDEAWFQIWSRLRSGDMQTMRRSDAKPVSFAELYGQPRSFRGRLVRFSGTVHRLQKVEAPPNNYAIEGYWQAWVEPDDGPASPIVVYFLRLPEGMPHGLKVREPVEVIGYFFKRWAYAATDTIRTAPLVMAIEPIWKPHKPPAPGGTAASSIALWTIAALVSITLIAMRLANAGGRRREEPPPSDLSAALSGVELFSTEEALRTLAAADKAAASQPPEPSAPKETAP
jgi:hypothetical protein